MNNINIEDIFNNHTLNIFTDASLTRNKNNTSVCSGYMCTINKNIIHMDTIVFKNKTINYGEAMAILLGIEYTIKYKNKIKHINLFSDSKINVLGIRELIFKWVKKEKDGVLYTSNGKLENQDIILTIINTILANNIHLCIYHQNSHIDINNICQLNDTRDKFMNTNGINSISIDVIRIISYYNNCIDKYTREVLMRNLYKVNELKDAIHVKYKPFDMNKYKSLIN